MEKYVFENSLGNIVSKVSEVEGESFVYRLRDGSFLKVFTDDFDTLPQNCPKQNFKIPPTRFEPLIH